MQKIIATLLCFLIIIYLFWVDQRNTKNSNSKAIWLPFIWFLFAASREFSFWLNYFFQIGAHYGTIEEGNPYERVFYTMMSMAGLYILLKRKVDWSELFSKNISLVLFFIFAACSFFWSDQPLVSFKRWVKSLGTVIMVLIILSEKKPYETLGDILRWLSFVLLPLSLLFIHYYPDLGRAYHHHSGYQMFTGVAGQKNSLGIICLFSSIYFFWNLFFNQFQKNGLGKKLHFSIYIIIFPIIFYLFYKANSATSIVCALITVCLFISMRLPLFVKKPNLIIISGIFFSVLLGLIGWVFNIKDDIITMLGRRPDLTDRVPLWEEMLNMVKNPIIGYGFESFWLGHRRERIIEHWGIDRQAHNGYLDMYLNLGIVGLFFMMTWIYSGLKKVNNYFMMNHSDAVLRLSFIIIFVLHNFTETSLFKTSIIWTLFLLGIIDSSPSQNQ